MSLERERERVIREKEKLNDRQKTAGMDQDPEQLKNGPSRQVISSIDSPDTDKQRQKEKAVGRDSKSHRSVTEGDGDPVNDTNVNGKSTTDGERATTQTHVFVPSEKTQSMSDNKGDHSLPGNRKYTARTKGPEKTQWTINVQFLYKTAGSTDRNSIKHKHSLGEDAFLKWQYLCQSHQEIFRTMKWTIKEQLQVDTSICYLLGKLYIEISSRPELATYNMCTKVMSVCLQICEERIGLIKCGLLGQEEQTVITEIERRFGNRVFCHTDPAVSDALISLGPMKLMGEIHVVILDMLTWLSQPRTSSIVVDFPSISEKVLEQLGIYKHVQLKHEHIKLSLDKTEDGKKVCLLESVHPDGKLKDADKTVRQFLGKMCWKSFQITVLNKNAFNEHVERYFTEQFSKEACMVPDTEQGCVNIFALDQDTTKQCFGILTYQFYETKMAMKKVKRPIEPRDISATEQEHEGLLSIFFDKENDVVYITGVKKNVKTCKQALMSPSDKMKQPTCYNDSAHEATQIKINPSTDVLEFVQKTVQYQRLQRTTPFNVVVIPGGGYLLKGEPAIVSNVVKELNELCGKVTSDMVTLHGDGESRWMKSAEGERLLADVSTGEVTVTVEYQDTEDIYGTGSEAGAASLQVDRNESQQKGTCVFPAGHQLTVMTCDVQQCDAQWNVRADNSTAAVSQRPDVQPFSTTLMKIFGYSDAVCKARRQIDKRLEQQGILVEREYTKWAGRQTPEKQCRGVQPPDAAEKRRLIPCDEEEERCIFLKIGNKKTTCADIQSRLTEFRPPCYIEYPFNGRDSLALVVCRNKRDAITVRMYLKQHYDLESGIPQMMNSFSVKFNKVIVKEMHRTKTVDELKNELTKLCVECDVKEDEFILSALTTLQLHKASDVMEKFAKNKLNLSLNKCLQWVYVPEAQLTQSYGPPATACKKIESVSPTIFLVFNALPKNKEQLERFTGHGVNINHDGSDHCVKLTGPPHETENATRWTEKALKDLSTLQIDEVTIPSGSEVKMMLQDAVQQTPWTGIDADAGYVYVPDNNMVYVIAKTYDKAQTAKHQFLVKIGAIKLIGRRGGHRAGVGQPSATGFPSLQLSTSPGSNRSLEEQPNQSFNFPKDAQMTEEFITDEGMNVKVYEADLLRVPVDCIVNAANGLLQHGGGVARVIAQAAGYDLTTEGDRYVRRNGVVPVGQAMTTTAGRLSFKCVVHTVGPCWYDYSPHTIQNVNRCERDLFDAIMNSFKQAEEKHLMSIALPAVSSAIFGVPEEICVEQYARATLAYSKQSAQRRTRLTEVHFVDKNSKIVRQIQAVFRTYVIDRRQPAYDVRQFVKSQRSSYFSQTDNRPIDTIASNWTVGAFENRSDQTVVSSMTVDEDCVICMDKMTNPKILKCGHRFCTECIDGYFNTGKQMCPNCGTVCGIITGDQPEGTVTITTKPWPRLTGFDTCGTISISYYFPNGTQGSQHPHPGKFYNGIGRTGYLPDNTKGKLIVKMLKVAFDRKLVFTIGNSRTTGEEGVITWNDIYHKTTTRAHGPCGYPDDTYLERVTEELAAKGVTEADL